METNERPSHLLLPEEYALAPIHASSLETPLKICVIVRLNATPVTGPFVLLREVPGSRVYLGAIADAKARVREWVEISVQTLDLKDMAFTGYQEQLSNHVFDQRWRAESRLAAECLAERFIATGMEEKNPGPILIKSSDAGNKGFLAVESVNWRVCLDDSALSSFGLPPYSTSPFRYLYEPDAAGSKTFLATSPDAPTNSHVQSMDRFSKSPGTLAVFNPFAGLVRVLRFDPIELEVFLELLEGRAWKESTATPPRFIPGSLYAELQSWSASPKGLPFLLHGANETGRWNEVFFLKLSMLLEMLKEVRRHVKAHQLPLLNLSPSSFRICVPETGDQFPALWSSRCHLVRGGQAYPLRIKSTEQRYFIRLGRVEPSPYLVQGMAAHSFGIGNIRLRNVTEENDGTVIEGTLVAEDYLGLDPNDLLWFKLPLGDERLEFFAHVYTAEAVGPREARFRTVPTRLAEPVAAALKRAAGTVFARAPYEIWPLLSSPCDLFSLGVIGVRTFLATTNSNLPVILDEVLGLARHFGKSETSANSPHESLRTLLDADSRLLDLVSPQALIEAAATPADARKKIQMTLWLEAMTILLRLFPGAGGASYCKDFGDVSPLALETVFNQPIEELERLVARLRSVLVPDLSANREIAEIVLEQLAAV